MDDGRAQAADRGHPTAARSSPHSKRHLTRPVRRTRSTATPSSTARRRHRDHGYSYGSATPQRRRFATAPRVLQRRDRYSDPSRVIAQPATRARGHAHRTQRRTPLITPRAPRSSIAAHRVHDRHRDLFVRTAHRTRATSAATSSCNHLCTAPERSTQKLTRASSSLTRNASSRIATQETLRLGGSACCPLSPWPK
jgi:hypothetical protein